MEYFVGSSLAILINYVAILGWINADSFHGYRTWIFCIKKSTHTLAWKNNKQTLCSYVVSGWSGFSTQVNDHSWTIQVSFTWSPSLSNPRASIACYVVSSFSYYISPSSIFLMKPRWSELNCSVFIILEADTQKLVVILFSPMYWCLSSY